MHGQTIVRADKLFRKQGTAGGTITAGMFIVRSGTNYVAATAGQHAEAIAIDGAAPGEKFAYTDQSGIQVRSPLGSGGALAVNDLVYLYDSGTIYAGASKGSIKEILDFRPEHFKLSDYDPHPAMKVPTPI